MDLALYTRVLWRFRVLVIGGFILACALAFFSYARLSFAGGSPKINYRQAQTWQSQTRLLITQPGFQVGKLSPGNPYANSTTPSAPVASQGWLASLAESYMQLGNSDAVQAMLARDHTVHGSMTVAAETTGPSYNSSTLPVVDINGSGPTGADAVHASKRGAAVFMAYIKQQQISHGVTAKNRVRLQVLNEATAAQILVKRKKTLPIVIFVAVMTAAIGLAFILENLRPRIHAVPTEAGEDSLLRKQASA